MKAIKRWDYFRKPKEDLERPTFCGAILSFLTIFLILYLSLSEFYGNTAPQLSKKIAIKNGPSGTNYFILNVDILFTNIPCAALTLTKKDLAGHDTISAYSGVYLQRLSSSNTSIGMNFVNDSIPEVYKNESSQVQKIVTGIIGHERCHVQGELTARKIPGSLIFAHDLKKDALKRIKKLNRELFDQINLSHQVNHLSFGGTYTFAELIDADNEIDLNSLRGTNISHDYPVSCSYYLKVIPISMFSHQEEDTEIYQYSHHVQCERADDNDELKAEVYIRYESTPITIQYSVESKGLLGTFISICGVACGIYVLARIVHSLTIKLLRHAYLED